MVWTHVATTTALGSGSAMPAVPTGTAEGDLLVLAGVSLGSPLSVDDAGYTSIRASLFGASRPHETWWKVAGSSEAAPTVTGVSTVVAFLLAFRWDGAEEPTLDVENGQANASTTATTAPGVTATGDDGLAIHTAGYDASTTHTPPSGFTEPTNGDNTISAVSYDLSVPSGATGSVAGVTAASANNAAHLAVFTVAAAGGGGAGPRRTRVGVGIGV